MNAMARTLPVAVLSDERGDLRTIFDYLRIAPTGAEAQRITRLGKSALSEILAGKRARDSRQRRHVALVAALIRDLASARQASSGSAERGASALGWLHSARVETSKGTKTPLEIFADTDLVVEQLGVLR